MKVTIVCVIFGVILATCVLGAAYKEGKTVFEKNYKVDIIKMTWGSKDKETDRLVGTARLYISGNDEPFSSITLTFDAYSRKVAADTPPPTVPNGEPVGTRAPLQAVKIDTTEVVFDFRQYGYRNMRNYIEGEFCADFPKNSEVNRLTLCNVKVSGAPVTYQTTFNINESLLKTSFTLSEPKAVPQVR